MQPYPAMKRTIEPTVVRVTGTTPLSFELSPGKRLTVKKIGPSAKNRPTAGSKFKGTAYLLFDGVTKIGRLSDAALTKLGKNVPETCTVKDVNEAKKVLTVVFDES
jgi:hypothetical protein